MPSADTAPLLRAFTTLISAAPPERAAVILRHAIKLVLDDTPQRRIGSQKDPEAWAPIRAALRQAMTIDKLSAASLARHLGVSASVVDKASALHGPTPSDATIALIRTWLASREVPSAPGGAAAATKPAFRDAPPRPCQTVTRCCRRSG